MKQILSRPNSDLQSQKQKLEASLNKNKVGLGWLRFTSSIAYLDYVRQRLKQYFKVELLPTGKGWNGYSESLQGSFSIIIGYTPKLTEQERLLMGIKPSPNEGLMTTDIPQSALDSLSSENLYRFWIDVYGIEGVRFTRVDVYYDDYNKLIEPRQVVVEVLEGRVAVPRINLMKPFSKYSMNRRRWEGYTVYFGSERSEKQIRYYDKFAESGGRLNCYRWEVELKGAKAEAFQEWFSEQLSEAAGQPTPEATTEVIANAYKSTIKASLAFLDISHFDPDHPLPRNWAARSPFTWWWSELVAGLEPANLTVSRVEPTLASTKNWFTRQVAPALAILKTVYGNWGIIFGSWLDRELEKGEERWNERHWKLLQEALLTSPAT
jgi:hypothetical protein